MKCKICKSFSLWLVFVMFAKLFFQSKYFHWEYQNIFDQGEGNIHILGLNDLRYTEI